MEPADICYLRVITQSCDGQVKAQLSTIEMQITRWYDVRAQEAICFPVFCSDRHLTKKVTLDLLEGASQNSLLSIELDGTYENLYATRSECLEAEGDGVKGTSLAVTCSAGEAQIKTTSRKGPQSSNIV